MLIFKHLIKSEKFLFFVGGIAAAAIVPKVVKSRKAREFGVKGLATGMRIQRQAQETFYNMKEEATDICVDASIKAAQESGGNAVEKSGME